MKSIPLACLSLAFLASGAAQAQSEYGRHAPESQAFPEVLASPGLYKSGNECAPDRAEAAWGPGGKFLGYMCVRNPSPR